DRGGRRGGRPAEPGAARRRRPDRAGRLRGGRPAAHRRHLARPGPGGRGAGGGGPPRPRNRGPPRGAPPPAPRAPAGGAAGRAGPLRVVLRDVRVRYDPAGPLALNGIDLELREGRRVALIGPSGAGKSTVAGLLLRFCELSGGSATLGGAGLARYRADDVRTVIGGGPPEPPNFHATNPGNGPPAPPGAGGRGRAGPATAAAPPPPRPP